MRSPATAQDSTVGRETAIVFATEVWILLSSVAIQALLAWSLGPEGRGSYAVCLVFATFIGFAFRFGVERGAQYQVVSRRLSLSRAASVAFGLCVVGSLVGLGAGGLLIESPISFFQKADTSSFSVSLLMIPLTIFNGVLILLLQGLRRYRRVGLVYVARHSAKILLIIALVWGLGLGVEGALLAMVVASLIAAVLMFLDLWFNCGFRFVRFRWRHMRPTLSYGARYYPAGIGHLVDLQMGTLLLGLLATRAEIGLFAAILGLTQKVLIFSQSLETSLLPRLAAASPEKQRAMVGTSVRIAWLLTAGAIAALLVVSEPLVSLILSPKFLPAVPLIWILAPGVVLQGGTKVLMSYFRATNRPGIVSWATWVSLVINSVVALVLYPVIGLEAAAWAMTIGLVSRTLVLVVAYLRQSQARLSSLIMPQWQDLDLLKEYLARIQTKLALVSGRLRPSSE